jgi:hypothetical protein
MTIKELSMNFEFKTDVNVDIKVCVNGFTAGRPAPICSNPSNYQYSDPGDPAEFDNVELFFIVDDKEIPCPRELYDMIVDQILDKIFDEGQEQNCQDRYDYDDNQEVWR